MRNRVFGIQSIPNLHLGLGCYSNGPCLRVHKIQQKARLDCRGENAESKLELLDGEQVGSGNQGDGEGGVGSFDLTKFLQADALKVQHGLMNGGHVLT